jgi:uncharacterized membrane protein
MTMIERSLYPRMGMALLALIGLIDSIYLSLSRLKLSGLACPVGGGCETVQNHAWSTIPPESGIAIAYIGVAGYALMFMLSMFALHRDTLGPLPLPAALLTIGMIAVAFGIYLISVQAFVIHAYCFWCVLSGIFGLSFALCAFLDWRAWRAGMSRLQVGALQRSDA